MATDKKHAPPIHMPPRPREERTIPLPDAVRPVQPIAPRVPITPSRNKN
jgi:hypothetical protein